MTTVVIGRTGQVATCLQPLMPDAVFLDRQALDLEQLDCISDRLLALKPDFLINAAAYTAVDRAEEEPARALRINGDAVRRIAETATAAGIPLVHLSTDYVFAGTQQAPYREDDPTSPQTAYGRSKLAGELAVRQSSLIHSWVFRTSWVFSHTGTNFVRTMLRLARERDEVRVVSDQHGIPTAAAHIATVLLDVRDRWVRGSPLPSGLYHLTSGGPATTWHGFAKKIFQLGYESEKLAGMPKLIPIATSEYPTLANRPANSVLESAKLRSALGYRAESWETGLRSVIQQL
ncbi:MAG: dTDP-4-dehydrorhamnose reductase [Pseudomonadales bacterium]